MSSAVLWGLLGPALLVAQSPPEMREILERLDRLEQQNRALAEEVHQLRQELAVARAPSAPESAPQTSQAPLEERVAVEETRTAELAENKVEASQHFPIRITGMALFNAFRNSAGSGGQQYPLFAWLGNVRSGGGSFAQTTIGLDFSGPHTVLGGNVSGSVYMDFFGGSGAALDQDFRIRTAQIKIDWPSRSIMVGLESPIFAPRSPSSLAQVAFAPLSEAGNLWLWIPQVRFEQNFHFTDSTGLRAQVGAVQTVEGGTPYSSNPQVPEAARPGAEGRLNFYHNLGDERRLEIAPGFHVSTTHVAGTSVPSSLFSLDWFANPWEKLEFSGAFFSGRNVDHLGGFGPGFYVLEERLAFPIHSEGGWAQVEIPATKRLSFHVFSGIQQDRRADVLNLVASPYSMIDTAIARNWLYGANLFYRLAPNVLLAVETSQVRTLYLGKEAGTHLNNHYDLALAYLF